MAGNLNFRKGSNGRDWNRHEPVPEIRHQSSSGDEREFSQSASPPALKKRSTRDQPIRRSTSHESNPINRDVENVIDDRDDPMPEKYHRGEKYRKNSNLIRILIQVVF